jgi:HEAT repeats
MQTGSFNWKWIGASVVIVSVSAYADVSSNGINAAQTSLQKTRLELRAQGFKTDLTNFDLSTSPDSRAREAILKAAGANHNSGRPTEYPDLMEPTASNRAVVVWGQGSLSRQNPSAEIDAACAAILAGPIQFNLDAAAGNYMLLPHLALLKQLTQTLNDRAMLALEEGNREAAWTNLLAATRLVTAWNPEPVEISQRVRVGNATLEFKATWQVLQTNGWTDSQLAQLQHEWETADFLSRLPEVEAFRRAGDLKALETDTPAPQMPQGAMYEDAKRLLLFYRDREIEYRNAVQARTWMQMRPMPGVTNEVFFEPKQRYGRFAMRLQQRRISMGFIGEGISLWQSAAEAEAERRVVITALALERYRRRYNRYPETLQVLAPEFLKSVPMDFVTGQPLHYRVAEGGHFLLYSVGLDCVDNGGKIETRPTGEDRFTRMRNPNLAVPESDIVWPLAASSAEVAALRAQQAQVEAQRDAQSKAESEAQEKADKQGAAESRQAAMKELLARKPSLGKEPVYEGMPLSSWVTRLGSDEIHGAPEDAVTAVRAIGSNAVPFLLEWMPHPGAEHPVEGFPNGSDVEIAWWTLGAEGKSAIPALARIINRPPTHMHDYSAWTHSANAISHLGPDAIVPMLTAATNMAGHHELWELIHNFENLGTNGAPAVPALLQWAKDPDYFVRAGVVSALGGIGKRPDLAVPVLLDTLEHDSNSMVRRDAAEALGAFAEDSDAVLPELIKTLHGNDGEARGGALSGLGRIQSRPETVVPLIAPYLSDKNSVGDRQAAYALLHLGSRAGLLALLRSTNDTAGVTGIADIIYQAVEIVSGEEEARRRQEVVANLARIYARGERPELPDLKIEGRPLSQVLSNQALAGRPLRLDEMLALRRVATTQEADTVTFELPLSYDALTNVGTLRLLCDADPGERTPNEAIVQEFQRATNGNCRLAWDTDYDPPGQHFLQAELVIYRWHSRSKQGNYIEQETLLKGPLFSFFSTNTVQLFPHGDSFTDYGAFFLARLARPVGSYALELTTLSGEHIHTITGSTTNGVVEAQWDLRYGDGKCFTGDSFNSSWTVEFPDSPKPASANAAHPK